MNKSCVAEFLSGRSTRVPLSRSAITGLIELKATEGKTHSREIDCPWRYMDFSSGPWIPRQTLRNVALHLATIESTALDPIQNVQLQTLAPRLEILCDALIDEATPYYWISGLTSETD